MHAKLLQSCPYGLWPSRLLWPWDSPDKNTGVGFHALLQGIFPTQGSNSFLLWLLHLWWILHCRATWKAPVNLSRNTFYKYLLSQIFDKHWTRGNSWTEFSYVQWQGDIYFLLDGTVLKNQYRRWGFDPWVGKIPWSGKWQPTAVFLPGKFHGQRSLAGHSPWGQSLGHNWANETEAWEYTKHYK